MNQFRIGGVYRTRDGELMRLVAFVQFSEMRGRPVARAVPVSEGSDWREHAGGRFLDDGKYVHANYDYDGDLIPGELHQVNGEWLPIDTNPAWTQAVDKAAQKYAPEPKREPLHWNKPTSIDRFPGFTVTISTTEDDPIHLHPLQKMAEGKEGFGSAALLKG